jgi:hypothetical protein
MNGWLSPVWWSGSKRFHRLKYSSSFPLLSLFCGGVRQVREMAEVREIGEVIE